MQNINRVVMTANLTRDPELKSTGSGTSVCQLRVASNSRAKENDQWVDKPNYFDVVCFGAQADNCQKFLAKGRPIAVDGRLDWREWNASDGSKRQSIQIIADSIQFLSDGKEHSPGQATSSVTASAPPPISAPPAAEDDDIPF